MDDFKAYVAFQRAVFEGAQEAARLDAIPEPAFIPYGRCRLHPHITTFIGGFDTLCPECEQACNDAMMEDEMRFMNGEARADYDRLMAL
jgi:hypothetical protein